MEEFFMIFYDVIYFPPKMRCIFLIFHDFLMIFIRVPPSSSKFLQVHPKFLQVHLKFLQVPPSSSEVPPSPSKFLRFSQIFQYTLMYSISYDNPNRSLFLLCQNQYYRTSQTLWTLLKIVFLQKSEPKIGGAEEVNK